MYRCIICMWIDPIMFQPSRCITIYIIAINYVTLCLTMYTPSLSSLYGVVLVTGMELSNNPSDIISTNNGRLQPLYPGQNGVYTAAVYARAEDVPTVFIAGDNTITTAPDGTEYVNRGLSEDTTYGVFYDYNQIIIMWW